MKEQTLCKIILVLNVIWLIDCVALAIAILLGYWP